MHRWHSSIRILYSLPYLGSSVSRSRSQFISGKKQDIQTSNQSHARSHRVTSLQLLQGMWEVTGHLRKAAEKMQTPHRKSGFQLPICSYVRTARQLCYPLAHIAAAFYKWTNHLNATILAYTRASNIWVVYCNSSFHWVCMSKHLLTCHAIVSRGSEHSLL